MLYEIARAERGFEIAQLVQRNNFVMVFQGVLFAGFLQAAASAPTVAVFIVSVVGLLTALAQVGLAAGAKFWQERWEIEVEQIERALADLFAEEKARNRWFPLFTRPQADIERQVRKRMSGKLFAAARWSPSRIPIFVAVVFVAAWFALAAAQVRILPGVGFQLCKLGAA